jgi:2-amino-4-hydroxy-6-hydroxymethyldihydropteridine diphosphokinase
VAWRYLIALGSNRRHHRHGLPRAVLAAALAALAGEGVTVEMTSPVLHTAPLGPSRRRYANAAALVRTALPPPDLLARLKAVERAFGRRRGGQRWAARVLDLDIVLWQGGAWTGAGLSIPHRAFRQRAFVLTPATRIAPRWRDPVTGLTLRQLSARLTRSQPLPIDPSRWGP